MEPFLQCGYLSRVVDLPIALAEVLFDDATRSLETTVRPEPAPVGTALLPARRVRTRVRRRIPFAAVAVEIELSLWSRSRAEVGIRYGGSRRPHAIARSVYEARAPQLLDEVTKAINNRVPGSAENRRAA